MFNKYGLVQIKNIVKKVMNAISYMSSSNSDNSPGTIIHNILIARSRSPTVFRHDHSCVEYAPVGTQ